MSRIILKNVTKKWSDNVISVNNVSLEIPDNSFVILTGPSLCGKTTLVRMIAGLENPSSGQIRIDDKVVFDSSANIRVRTSKRTVGFLFQNCALWPHMTVYQNISFGLTNIKGKFDCFDATAKQTSDLIRVLSEPNRIKKEIKTCKAEDYSIDRDKALIKLIDAFNISIFTANILFDLNIHEEDDPTSLSQNKLNFYKEKFEDLKVLYVEKNCKLKDDFIVYKDDEPIRKVRKLTSEEIDCKVREVARMTKIGMLMNKYPDELSKEEQQRVAIARTLATESEILIMDEPLKNLDAEFRLMILQGLQRLHSKTNKTLIYVTSNPIEAKPFADIIYEMDKGVLKQI